MSEITYTIQFVSKVTGINPHTIRAWEKRYQAVTPTRDKNGRRAYTQELIDRLSLLHDVVKAGNSISDVANLEESQLKEIKSTLQKSSNFEQTLTPIQTTVDINSILQNLIMALKFYKLDIISHELIKLRDHISARDFALNVLSPLMGEVGKMCEMGQISIGQEHALSSIIKFHVGQYLYGHHVTPMQKEINIAIATPPGEHHEFGILIAALLCTHYRIRFYFLGCNMPVDSLAQTTEQIRSQVIILGLSQHFQTSHQKESEEYLRELASLIPSETKIWAGGFPKIPKDLNYEQIEQISTLQMLDYNLSQL